MNWRVECADVVDWCAEYEGEKFHAVLCDPPYHLIQSSRNGSMRKPGTGPYGRHKGSTKGFMGKDWDGGSIAFDPATWAAIAEHLHPGGFILAFGSSRGWHRLACALEDAGLIIHPTIFCWLTGQGFPKSTRIERTFANGNSPFCQCENSPQQSHEGDSLSNDPGVTNIIQDSQSDCQENLHSCGEQPLEVLGTVQDVLPLQDGVPEHSRDGQREGAQVCLSASTCPDANSDLPSKSDCLGQNDHQSRECQAHDNIQSDNPSSTSHVLQTEHHKKVSRKSCKSDLDGDSVSSSLDTSDDRGYLNIPHCNKCGKLERGIWEGHRYGLQALKPAAEPLIVAQKPYEGRPVDCITSTGAGAYWIDGARVGASGGETHKGGWQNDGPMVGGKVAYHKGEGVGYDETPKGRWPPNVVLSHLSGCKRRGVKRVRNQSGKASGPTSSVKVGYTTIGDFTGERGDVPYYAAPDGTESVADWSCVEGCPVKAIGEMSGDVRTGMGGGTRRKTEVDGIKFHSSKLGKHSPVYYDTGTAARFYPQFAWQYEIAERLAGVVPFKYQAKAGRRERDAGLEGTNGKYQADINKIQGNGIYRNRCVVCNASLPNNAVKHCGKKPERIREDNVKVRNPHPTVKPIELCKWLATLLLPPPEYAPRRILVPFGGSGSEAIGAGLAGWDEIVMVEMEEEYCTIAEARLTHWLEQMQLELNI